MPLIAFFVVLIGIASCGLPDYTVIDSPTKLNPSESHVVAFRTPKNDIGIDGYAIYYKIYASDTDRNSEEDESHWFNASSSKYNVTEIQPGPVVPNQRGFFRVGVMGESDLGNVSDFYIEHPGPNIEIYIDFDTDGDGLDDKSNDEPVIGLGPLPITSKKELARGFIDPLDTFSSDSKLRSFIGDWRFDEGNKDGFHDGDLRRKGWGVKDYSGTSYDVMQYQPGSAATPEEIKLVGNPIFGGDTIPSEIQIGFVVHSYGLSLSGRTFGRLYSIPAYIGTITYQDPSNTGKRSH